MAIKLIIFDLDGVLVNSREMHYHVLNRALENIDKKYIISIDEHLSTYDGLSTTKKLQLLTKNKNLDPTLHNQIWKNKQKETWRYINENYTYDEEKRNMLKSLKNKGYIIYVASNSVYETIKLMLLRKGFMEYIDYFISNEDVVNPKPSPEMYMKCMIRKGFSIKQTLIIEDSHIGRKAAYESGSYVLGIKDSNDINLKKIEDYIKMLNTENTEKQLWDGYCNIVIPMAGEGSRFKKVGFCFPKPLIEVNEGKPMIQLVVENIGINPKQSRFIFIVREEHIKKYNIEYLLRLIAPNCIIIPTDGLTEGAACSILLAKDYINNKDKLFLANSDQFVEWEPNIFMYSVTNDNIDGAIATFNSTHPKYSYAKLDENGYVCEVAEKKPISDNATVGFYYFKHGSDFVEGAERMIKKNIRVNNEFYTCPVFNELIEDGKKIKCYPVDRYWCIGDPSSYEYFMNNYKV